MQQQQQQQKPVYQALHTCVSGNTHESNNIPLVSSRRAAYDAIHTIRDVANVDDATTIIYICCDGEQRASQRVITLISLFRIPK
ncbi:unnamed protein product [Trichogramma brassicae]|uniref:Uncharacterized protein n=1 Tax=Trichogramma brassicae TaxID=86971 RepID=A0A6H5I3S6_9HYME|nr:unnamed protein product [Trichogramma brassicae]